MDLLWRVFYSIIIGVLLWLLHTKIGSYPAPLPKSAKPKQEFWEVMFLWGVAAIASLVMMAAVVPWLNRTVTSPMLRQLAQVPFLTLPYIVLPLFMVRRKGWSIKDLGLSWRSQSQDVSIFAVVFGILSGSIAYITGQTVVGLVSRHWGELLLLLYNNVFIEEFYFRGVIQATLERAVGQMRALLWSGILYGAVHIMLDISVLLETGVLFVLFALLLQTMAGWLLGMIFMKTRSLWPGISCHYLVNWLPSILSGMLG
jgi:membrane protease YdiL (CAAX protease family)